MVAVVDSGSTDGSDIIAAKHQFELCRIDARSFNHGRTRQEAVERFCHGKQFVIFLTQDAVIEGPDSLNKLLHAFTDPCVGAACGRQLPHRDAKPFEAHAALFNYPPASNTRSLADAQSLGAKVTYLSNSFAAYRTRALSQCGGFPAHLILAEDAYVAMRMLMMGWSIRYCADALVRHSHSYSIAQEMSRYFDFGVMHAQTPEMIELFGAPEGEGLRFVLSEFRYILGSAPLLVLEVPFRNAAKYAGYRLGRAYKRLPNAVCRRLSMTKGYWNNGPSAGLTDVRQ